MSTVQPLPGAPRVMLVFGTRPEAIKMLPILAELRRRPGMAPVAVSTGQHRGMLDQALDAFGERCEVELGAMRPGQALPDLFSRIQLDMGRVLEAWQPGLVLVHGDTTTALAAALAASFARIPVGHVEAGLRSFDLDQPWPEEMNRVMVDVVAELMFAPTEGAAANLRAEYNRRGRILVTGNTGIDALLATAARIGLAPEEDLPALDPRRRLVLVTAHRRESLGPGLLRICDAVAALATRGDVELVWPLHCNPAVRGPVRRRLEGCPGVHLVEPLGYRSMVWLMRRAALLLTDSGGLQEEGPALGKPVLVMRDVTERPEALASGAVRLVGTRASRIRAEAERLLDDPAAYAAMARPAFPFGDGTAARRIVDAIEAWAAERTGQQSAA